MAFERQIKRGVQQRMARADEGRQWLALRRDERLLEGDALVARQHRFADPDETVAVADRRRDMGNFVAARLPLAGSTAELLKGFEEKGLDVVRLQAASLGALYLLAYAGHTTCI